MIIIKVIKQHIGMVSTVVTAVVGILGGIWAINEHFATAADLSRVEKSIDAVERSLTIGQRTVAYDLQIQLNSQSMRDIKGKIGDIEDREAAAPKTRSIADPVDAMRKKRLNESLEELKETNARLEREKFQTQKELIKR